MNCFDWYLNKLDITQYVLRKPKALQGEAATHIDDNICLIVVAKHRPQEKIFSDILNAIKVSEQDCLHLTPAQLIMPLESVNRVIWFINEPLPESWQQSTILSEKVIINTVSLAELSQSPQLKRQLWQELCRNDKYIHPQSE